MSLVPKMVARLQFCQQTCQDCLCAIQHTIDVCFDMIWLCVTTMHVHRACYAAIKSSGTQQQHSAIVALTIQQGISAAPIVTY